MERVHRKLTTSVAKNGLGFVMGEVHLFGLRYYLDFNSIVERIARQILVNGKIMRNIKAEVKQVVREGIDRGCYVDAGGDVGFTAHVGIIIPLDSRTFLLEEFIEKVLGINIDYE